MSNQDIVVLNDDQKQVAIKAAADLRHAVAYLNELFTQDKLTEEMRITLCGLLDHYVKDLCEPLGYNSEAQKRLDAQYAEIRKLNGKINELERQLGEAAPIDTVPNLLRNLYDDVSKWWQAQGMGWINEFDYSPYGKVHVKFSFAFDHVYTGSRKSKQDNIKFLEEQGFVFVVDDGDHRLLDCDGNRELLANQLTKRFPSIQIHCWENRSVHRSNKFALWRIDAYINDIHDLVIRGEI